MTSPRPRRRLALARAVEQIELLLVAPLAALDLVDLDLDLAHLLAVLLQGAGARVLDFLLVVVGGEQRAVAALRVLLRVLQLALLLGFLLKISLLWTLGIIVLIVGLVLLVLGSMNRSVGGRRHYW